MSPTAGEYPIFPLSTVLFPGGTLALRIFEPRYLAMVRDCTRDGRPFGVTLLLRGREDSETTTALAIGTLARIVDFNTLPDGLLGIRCSGEQRFHVDHVGTRKDGLLIGKLTLWADEPQMALPPEFFLLSRLAQGLVENLIEGAPEPTKAELDDASWVSFRLAELLPFALGEKQQLLELTDASERLQRIVDALPRFRSDATDADDDSGT
ncbi:MAG: LON peptidase substrate-binding domain-containing protein [Rhodanobacteraceae bacterium]|nr:LON peptidase substrate-binding domain-containing protein [Rhodanobacteraceae bacterium]